ncbi:ABC-type antimicrobial peptide transport system, ATPase component [Desulfitobacterium dichloroeliminans LMG P-21439]|uniref:ABC-type antimicrobial peptide transport system, ATPase component n=1 Tax=Desulfitobacterium dichloroeliminans (strain LMG P-21439 / DCA1) TaxID=871963 RepID=L0F6M8_DESDL|nr:ABC transporter ATP-binding protein [Desulfitobacterium dichloroeliminans]AGA68598.1 ABC-type antimicrobial peptide transport system, ATPase component [Desulfitobacterium dichloroeliminans LMG P-21439]
MSLIKVNNVSKVYQGGDGEVLALKNINLEVTQGQFLALLGPSGSGKSTLLSILGALNPSTEGKVLIDDIDIYGLDEERRSDFRHEYIGFVFQQYQLIPYLTALENVMLPLAITKYSDKEQREMAQKVLGKVGLGNKSMRLPNQLSGGEQNRVAIARAIVNEPVLLFADEPTGSLDSTTAKEILGLFQSLNRDGQTIIMVTHNLENLAYVSHSVQIRDGIIERNPEPVVGDAL